MLEQMLKAIFESDKKAASNDGSERIKADVLSRIESEKPMKHIRIKPLIIAAAVSVVGVMSAVTVSAANEPGKNILFLWRNQTKESGEDEYWEEHDRRQDTATIYYMGKADEEFRSKGNITVEKELDETDYIGYAEPCQVYFQHPVRDMSEAAEELAMVRQIEEDPGSLGLVPIGKSETFEGGLRIVNRHFENTNESINGEKTYYSLRRVYTDDPENRLLASIYLGCEIWVPENNKQNAQWVLRLLIDHTEEGCVVGNKAEDPNYWMIFNKMRNYGQGSLMGDYVVCFADYYFKSLVDDKPVTVGAVIAVSDDGIQLLD